MDHFRLVRPEHMNHYGFLFGGYLLQWIDEIAYITAAVEFPEHRFVTVAMDNVEFHERIQIGEVLRLCVDRTRVGSTSVRYRIQAFGTVSVAMSRVSLFETGIVFVNVDERGHKKPIRPS